MPPVADETRVRTEKTGRIGHEAVTEATYVFDRSGRGAQRNGFSFLQSFFLWAFCLQRKKRQAISLLSLTEKLQAQKVGREHVFSADLWYNGMGDENGS